jgi:hypothetical protein
LPSPIAPKIHGVWDLRLNAHGAPIGFKASGGAAKERKGEEKRAAPRKLGGFAFPLVGTTLGLNQRHGCLKSSAADEEVQRLPEPLPDGQTREMDAGYITPCANKVSRGNPRRPCEIEKTAAMHERAITEKELS